MMVGPADLQASLLGRFRRAVNGGGSDTLSGSRKDERPVAKGAPPSSSSSSSSGNKAVVEELKDVGQRLSRFTAAVLEEEKSGSGSGSSSLGASSGGGSSFTSGRSIQGSTLRGLPNDFLTKPLSPDEDTVRGASAVVRTCYMYIYARG
jgi:hypothetical protein